MPEATATLTSLSPAEARAEAERVFSSLISLGATDQLRHLYCEHREAFERIWALAAIALQLGEPVAWQVVSRSGDRFTLSKSRAEADELRGCLEASGLRYLQVAELVERTQLDRSNSTRAHSTQQSEV